MENKAKIIGTFVAIAIVGLIAINVFYTFSGSIFNKPAEIVQQIKETTDSLKKELEQKVEDITPDEHKLRIAKCKAVMASYELRKSRDSILGQIHDGMNDQEFICFKFLEKLSPEELKDEPKVEENPTESNWSWWNPLTWF